MTKLNVLQRAILNFYAHNLIPKEEEKRLRQVFEEVDEDGDGMLSFAEVKNTLIGNYDTKEKLENSDDPKAKTKAKAKVKAKAKAKPRSKPRTPKMAKLLKKQTKKIFKILDSENTKLITYEEFLRAMFDKTQLEKETSIKKCFEALDRNNNKLVSLEELKEIAYFDEFDKKNMEAEFKKIFLGYSKGRNSVRMTR